MRKMFSILAFTAAFLSLSAARTEAEIQLTPLPGPPTDAEVLANALVGSPGVDARARVRELHGTQRRLRNLHRGRGLPSVQ